MDRITTVSSDKAFDYANEALDIEKNPNFFKKLLSSGDREGILEKKGFVYYYKISNMDNGNSLVVFVDATSRMENVNVVKDFTIIIVLICFMVFFLLVSIMSKILVRSFVEDYEKQKMFITNAGHELKTPLAIISANTEVVEMVSGESEWTKSIKNQVERMTKLIGELITLAKADEKKNVEIVEFDFSELIQTEVDSFKTVAVQSGKTLETKIEENITIKSDKNGLREVVSVLTDNAIKYCDDEGTIKVESHKKGKKVFLSVSNTYAEGKNLDYSRFFDRFYRADESHNSEKKGYGIGLSLAEACIKGCKGKINVTYAEDTITFNVILPVQ
jgi:signal transduction histidine kinase